LDLGIFLFQYRGQSPWAGACPSTFNVKGGSVDFLVVFVEPVKVQFILDPKEDQNTACDSDSKACDVDEGISFVFFDDPKCDFKVVFNHDKTPVKMRFEEGRKGDQDLVPDPAHGPEFSILLTDIFKIFLHIAG
jgi:hypothetical protein